jgi:hypothetical protein
MFRHVVLIRWKPESTAAQRAAVPAALLELPGQISQLRRYQLGADAGVDPGNADFAIVAEFDSADDYRIYRDHPSHRQVIETLIRPILESRMAVQYHVD